MRFGNPVQSVMVIASATAASFGGNTIDRDDLPALKAEPAYDDGRRQARVKSSKRGHGYAKQRREARKRRNRRR